MAKTKRGNLSEMYVGIINCIAFSYVGLKNLYNFK